jgi:hypothetical protein
MHSSQPDDASSPSPGRPPKSRQSVPPGVVYALDCLEHSTPAQTRRHLVALGYSPEEAAAAVRAAVVLKEGEPPPSAWSPEDSAARRCMSLGFLMLLCAAVAGTARMFLQHSLPATIPVTLGAFALGCVFVGIGLFLVGIIKLRFRR